MPGPTITITPMTTIPSRTRSGFIAVLALGFLLVISILIAALLFAGSSTYSQTARSLYALRAQLLAQGALEEARAAVYDKINRPRELHTPTGAARSPARVPDWKPDLFSALVQEHERRRRRGQTHEPSGPLAFRGSARPFDLLAAGILPDALVLAREGGVTLKRATVSFHDFRPLCYTDDGSLHETRAYYQDPTLDAGGLWNKFRLYDFVGYYTIEIESECRGESRRVSATHDVKVINVTPPGHEFVMFQSDATQGTDQAGDLNGSRGGALRLFGRGWGRISMRGPYLIESEGFHQGDGGDGPEQDGRVVSNFYIDRNHWYGWALIPDPRAALIAREFGFPVEQKRPLDLEPGIWKTSIAELSSMIPATGSVWRRLGLDPGFYIAPDQVYFSAYAPVSGNEFSILGNLRGVPVDPAEDPDRFSLFRGKWFKIDKDGIKWYEKDGSGRVRVAERAYDPCQYASNLDWVGRYIYPPPIARERDQRWYLTPEVNAELKVRGKRVVNAELSAFFAFLQNLGKLISRIWRSQAQIEAAERRKVRDMGYKVEDYRPSSGPFSGYFRSPSTGQQPSTGVASVPFCLNWEPQRSPSLLATLLDWIASAAPLLTLSPATLVLSTLGRRIGLFPPTLTYDPFEGLTPADGSAPTNQKIWMRAATRHYRRLSDLASIREGQRSRSRPLVLDGVIWVEELDAPGPFFYRGKGVVVQARSGEPLKAVVHAGTRPVAPGRAAEARVYERAPDTERSRWGPTDHYLTVVSQAASEEASRGRAAIVVEVPRGGLVDVSGRRVPAVLDASLVSNHGVTVGDESAIVHGNVVVGLVNKSRIPRGRFLHVRYHDALLRPVDPVRWDESRKTWTTRPRDFNSGGWHQLAITPRLARYRAR